MRFLLVALLACIASAEFCAPAQLPQLTLKNGQYVDPSGRIIIFHGLNVVNKYAPYLSNYVTPAQVQIFAQEWGINAVRTGFLWDGYEHFQNHKNLTYLADTVNVANQLFAPAGIYSLVDIHQDYFSGAYCGDGAPDWAVLPDPSIVGAYPFPLPVLSTPFPRGSNGLPVTTSCPPNEVIGEFYLAYEQIAAWFSFYTNVQNIQSIYNDMLGDLAWAFYGNSNIIGIEIMNEPFPPLVEDYNSFLNSSYGDEVYLQPWYDVVSSVVRSQNPQVPLVFEPLQTNGEVLARKMGFTHPPGGHKQAGKDVLSFHLYCAPNPTYEDCLLAGPQYAEDCNAILAGDPDYCYTLFDKSLALRISEAKALGVVPQVTEYGSFTGNQTLDADFVQYIGEISDSAFVSSFYWDILWLTTYGNSYLIPSFVRPYAQAIAGTPSATTWNQQTKTYTFTYTPSTQIQAPTEIFVPVTIHYPKGFVVTVSPNNAVKVATPQPNLVTLTVDQCEEKAKVTVTITARK